MNILEGKTLAQSIIKTIRKNLDNSNHNRKPKLVILTVGSDPASEVYVRNKIKSGEQAGMIVEHIKIEDNEKWYSVLSDEIVKQNFNSETDGIIVQLPLPDMSQVDEIIDLIDPIKDVDGFGVFNMGLLIQNSKQFHHIPATVAGILHLIKKYNIKTEGENVVILGRSNIVGRPLSILLSQPPYNANVTVLHSKSNISSLYKLINNTDILISATGNQDVIDFPLYVPTLIDVGIHRTENGLQGDIKKEFTSSITNITPVPGGVGPLTVAMLLSNTYNSFLMRMFQL